MAKKCKVYCYNIKTNDVLFFNSYLDASKALNLDEAAPRAGVNKFTINKGSKQLSKYLYKDEWIFSQTELTDSFWKMVKVQNPFIGTIPIPGTVDEDVPSENLSVDFEETWMNILSSVESIRDNFKKFSSMPMMRDQLKKDVIKMIRYELDSID